MVGFHSVADLRAQFLGSPEFLEQNRVPRLAHHENVVIKEIDGAHLFVDLADYEVGLNIINGIYEPAEQDFIRRLVRPGEVAVDVGANIGFFSILLGQQVEESGHVYSFEPLPRNALLLKRSVDENGFASRITVERAAVGAHSGAMDLISARVTTNSGVAYLRTGDAVASGTDDVTPVRVVALDGYHTRRPVSFIKLDAEGAELLVLRGAIELITNDRPVILAEINPRQLAAVSRCSPDDVITTMRSLGFDCELLQRSGRRERITTYANGQVANVVFCHAGSRHRLPEFG